jgi:hypothetical protein
MSKKKKGGRSEIEEEMKSENIPQRTHSSAAGSRQRLSWSKKDPRSPIDHLQI